jgi:crotonobetainyl-CoA:carnitine CoA-transferase CaiB-like acyl-CoA transferase
MSQTLLGAYPCRGEERWIAIAVFSDGEWNKLCQAMGKPAWSRKRAFQTFLGRKAREDELGKLIAEWTRNYEDHELMRTLQKAGVRAGVVQDARDIYEDEQIQYRGQLVELEHTEIGKMFFPASAFILSKTPHDMRLPSPCLGEHNEFVYTKLLGLSDEEFVELQSCGALD